MSETKRTKEEIDKEYSQNAIMYGHLARMIKEQEKMLENHMAIMLMLAKEGMALEAEKVKAE